MYPAGLMSRGPVAPCCPPRETETNTKFRFTGRLAAVIRLAVVITSEAMVRAGPAGAHRGRRVDPSQLVMGCLNSPV